MNMTAAAVLTSLALLHTPALAQQVAVHAELRLTVVDEANAPLPNATVTVFTIHGPRTVKADETGVVVIAELPAELTQVWARTPELSNAQASTLKPGANKRKLTLRATKPLTETESGS
jgi:hypothetical protein